MEKKTKTKAKTQKQIIEELAERVEKLEQLVKANSKKVNVRTSNFISNIETK
jgi:hypothetical protein